MFDHDKGGEPVMPLHEIYFGRLATQSSIYGLAKIDCEDIQGNNCIFVASLNGDVLLLQWKKPSDCTNDSGIPFCDSICFANLPDNADVIAIHAFRKSEMPDSPVAIAIIYQQQEIGSGECSFMNLYSQLDHTKFSISDLAQNCKVFKLDFSPMFLKSARLSLNPQDDTVLLVSGGEKNLQMFFEGSENHWRSAHELLPECEVIPSNVVCLCVVLLKDSNLRVTVMGCLSGDLILAVSCVCENVVLRRWTQRFDGPISSVKLFQWLDRPVLQNVSSCLGACVAELPGPQSFAADCFHLVVCSTIDGAFLFSNVAEFGLSMCCKLPEVDSVDTFLCSLVADVDLDGQKELLIGTYGQEVLIYDIEEGKIEDGLQNHWQDGITVSETDFSPFNDPLLTYSAMCNCRNQKHYPPYENLTKLRPSLPYRHHVTGPIHALESFDLTGDGLKDFIVLTSRGIHLLQHNMDKVKELILQRATTLVEKIAALRSVDL